MGATRTDLYTDEQMKIAAIGKVLGHPARVAILQYLLKQDSCICGEIVDEIGLSQPTISQHLREMKELGLIAGSTEGTKVCYCVDTKNFKDIKKTLDKVFDHKFTNCKC